jgi:hypothetical protein
MHDFHFLVVNSNMLCISSVSSPVPMLVHLQNQKCTIELVGTLLDLLLEPLVASIYDLICESEYCWFASKNLMSSMH